jgi:flagellar basal-body rod protein FlgG
MCAALASALSMGVLAGCQGSSALTRPVQAEVPDRDENTPPARLEQSEAIRVTLAALSIKSEAVQRNLANLRTPGYKAEQVILDHHGESMTVESADGSEDAGVLVASRWEGRPLFVRRTRIDTRPGPIVHTAGALDIALRGMNWLRVTRDAGEATDSAFTRDGRLAINADGNLCLADDPAWRIEPPIVVPGGASELTIGRDGLVTAQISGEAEPQRLGVIETWLFANPERLVPIGPGLYGHSPSVGEPIPGSRGVPTPAGRADRLGAIEQGYLEMSNVEASEQATEAARVDAYVRMLERVAGR